jgi:PBP1b-binding outer membrane lipoprotein LpoB
MKRYIIFLFLVLFLWGCSSHQEKATQYPRKPANTDGRKAGAAMLLYEQAEADADVNENFTLTPPDKKKLEGSKDTKTP